MTQMLAYWLGLVGSLISGVIPPGVENPLRVVWIDGGEQTAVACAAAASTWSCAGPTTQPGIVAIIGQDALAFVAVGSTGIEPAQTRTWGRLLVLTPSAADPAALADVTLAPRAPARSPHRPRTTRFMPATQPGVDVVRLSDAAFWVAGDDGDRDAFVEIAGSRIATTRISVAVLRSDAPEAGALVSVTAAVPLRGRVTDTRGAPVGDVVVELFEPLPALSPDATGTFDETSSVIRTAAATADGDGLFVFDRVAGGPFLVVVADPRRGRGTVVARSAADDVAVKVKPPPVAVGRVLRGGVPVAGARVRFIPAQTTLTLSSDPRDVLADEASSDHDGRFDVPLPPGVAGVVQITSADGAVARVGTPPVDQQRLELGDVPLPVPRRVLVRLLDAVPCELTATGPIGSLGLTTVTATPMGGVYELLVPEPGDWALAAQCGGRDRTVAPMLVSVPTSGGDVSVDVRLGT
jgi:hypothetical protein